MLTFFKIMSCNFQSKGQIMTLGGVYAWYKWVFKYSDIFSSHYVSYIMPFQIFPLWVRIRKSKIVLVTSGTYGYYGGDSTMRTICYVSSPPTRRELRPKARSESRELRLIFEPAQFPSSSTTRAQQECKVKRSGKLRANEVKVRCKRRKGSIICIHFQIISWLPKLVLYLLLGLSTNFLSGEKSQNQ